MASTVKVPLLGQQNKGTVIGVTIGGVTVTAYLIWRKQKKNAALQAATAQAAQQASGYGYGTASAAYGYGNGYYGYGGGSSGSFPAGYYGYGVPLPPTGPLPVANTTNAQWAQAAITQLENDGYDPQSVAAALGAYELGQPVTANQQSIIQAAIAVEGYPPVAGANGHPPAINVQGTTGGGTGGGQNPGTTPIEPRPLHNQVLIPNVSGESANTGLARLRAAGFKARTSPFRNPARTYVITSTSPAGGIERPRGSLVVANVRVTSPGTTPVEFSGGPERR
jgi:hypothetical protein